MNHASGTVAPLDPKMVQVGDAIGQMDEFGGHQIWERARCQHPGCGAARWHGARGSGAGQAGQEAPPGGDALAGEDADPSGNALARACRAAWRSCS